MAVPSDQLLFQTADITSKADTIEALDPDEDFENIARAEVNAGRTDFFAESRSNVLSDLNLRGYVNQRIAEFFSLPYAWSLARLPFRKPLYDRSSEVQQKLIAAQIINDRYGELAGRVTLRLPVFLALALKDATAPERLWASLAKLREDAKHFREHRKKLDIALARGDLREAAQISAALHTTLDGLLALAGGATMAATGVVAERIGKGDIEHVGLAISAVVAASQNLLKSTFMDRLIWRLRRPELLWMNKLIDEAHHITESMPDFARLWHIPVNRQGHFAERFEKMAGLAH